jgi:hypothetical protein
MQCGPLPPVNQVPLPLWEGIHILDSSAPSLHLWHGRLARACRLGGKYSRVGDANTGGRPCHENQMMSLMSQLNK